MARARHPDRAAEPRRRTRLSAPSASALVALAFDFGLRRIGIAAGDTLTGTAAPRSAARVHAHGPDWEHIAREIRARAPAVLIVGAPYNADGTPGALTEPARAFANELARRFKLPVEQIDERWSSLEAGEQLKAQRASGTRRRRIRPGDVDGMAAAVILERWMNARKDRP